jgi:indole-3-glycerol phosphate synthase
MHFLDVIVAEKKTENARLLEKISPDGLEELARKAKPPRDFARALIGGGRVIAEVKRRSPRIKAYAQARHAFGLPRIYARNGAAAISVVTDQKNFGTCLQDVRAFKAQVGLPILAKDFNIHPVQILNARAHGADAVLLIARLLSRSKLKALLTLTRDLGMEALVECHDESDVQNANEADASLIGINNRDLDRMRINLDTTRRLLPLVRKDALVVCESGISKREDIDALVASGVHAFLIGGALLQSRDPGALLNELTRPNRSPRESVGAAQRVVL